MIFLHTSQRGPSRLVPPHWLNARAVTVSGVTVLPRALSQCARIIVWMADAGPGWRKLMTDTNDNSKLDYRELTDTELNAVSGGRNEPTRHPAKVTVPDLKLSLSC
jgi:bacteriocin-like protein